jgi:hypothetical protein
MELPNAKHTIDKSIQCSKQLFWMNARIKRAVNFENLGARIMRNEALDQKIWALEGFWGQTVFLGVSGVILKFL